MPGSANESRNSAWKLKQGKEGYVSCMFIGITIIIDHYKNIIFLRFVAQMDINDFLVSIMQIFIFFFSYISWPLTNWKHSGLYKLQNIEG